MIRLLSLIMASALVMIGYRDYLEHTIVVWHVLVLWLISLAAAALGGFSLVWLVSLVVLVSVFAVPCVCGLGWGDFFVLTSLWPFLQPWDALLLFLCIFLIFWGMANVALMIKKAWGCGSWRERYRCWRKLEMPLVPVITVSFLVYEYVVAVI